MNSLRKTFLALSLIAVLPAANVQAVKFSDLKARAYGWLTASKEYLTEKAPSRETIQAKTLDALKWAKAHPIKTGAGLVATLAAYKYGKPVAKKSVSGVKSVAKAAYTKFNALNKKQKTGVVIAGAVTAFGLYWAAKKYKARNAKVNPLPLNTGNETENS